ncbi:hypothetical protein Acr_00g0021050 [Actinidia rufa]|uniref:Uncharacterized protein n=1 Tax=Actinidia rufa TaxID=165716 RepID=A0A7J0DDZ6_9ERIC|nr:hypothetical protein Acr_00g0021050 [Actinidia rufa]
MGEVGLEENPSFLRRVASGLLKLKNSALQLMPFISNTPADESPEVDLEAYGASTNHLHISNKPICECQDGQKKVIKPYRSSFSRGKTRQSVSRYGHADSNFYLSGTQDEVLSHAHILDPMFDCCCLGFPVLWDLASQRVS